MNNMPMNERKYYQVPREKEWNNRNYTTAFYPESMDMGTRNNTMFGEDGIGDLNHTTIRNGSLESLPSKQIIDIKMRQKDGNRKTKVRRGLGQNQIRVYNNKAPNQFPMSGLKFSNVNMKKRKLGNVFSGERNLNFDSGVKIDRNIIPNINFTNQNTQKPDYQIHSARLSNSKRLNSNRKQGENVFVLQRQIKDLRELLKEKDQQMLDQKHILSFNTMSHQEDDRQMLIDENQQLRHHLNLQRSKTHQSDNLEVAELKRDNELFKGNYDKLKILLEQKDEQVLRNEDLLKQKDYLIKYLEGQLKRYNIVKDEDEKSDKVIKGNYLNFLK
jgi:hypothetical protein